ncbi:hypothetical protein [Capillimicrobium parvum]|uniref:Secreted protein n=1 Tax=Capillimicrobium parvum TaxID=2884022 RepID=A0A9E6Y3E8_9ACTN|nr:hypothetical protein [Capillimicrobium parvum]UGS38843.1 hypothetical protein DSM104329_05273 [Capillimicrobium parvum]
MRRAFLLTLLLVLLPAAAAHASAAQVIRDCTDDGVLSGSYSQKELRSALANLPSDVDEYTNCRDVIRAAQLSGGSGNAGGGGSTTGGGSTGTGGGGTGATGTTSGGTGATGTAPKPKTGSSPGPFGGFSGYPADPEAGATKRELAAVGAAQHAPAENTSVAAATLPAPLVVALALGALGLIVLGALDLRRRVVARRGA